MGLLTCGRCGCAVTAERKKSRYTYYRCTGFRGRCGNSYIREELLAELLGDVVRRIEIPAELADWIAEGLRESQGDLECTRQESLTRAADRQRRAQTKLDKGYDDYLEGRISSEFWTRKSQEWEAEASAAAGELSRLSAASPSLVATGERISELAKTAYFRYQEQPMAEKRKLLDTVLSNCTLDRGSLCPAYSKPFDVLAKTVETGAWRGGRDEFRNWVLSAA